MPRYLILLKTQSNSPLDVEELKDGILQRFTFHQDLGSVVEIGWVCVLPDKTEDMGSFFPPE